MPALEDFYTDALDEEDEGEYFDATGLPKTPKLGSSRGSSNRRDTLHVRNLKFAESTAQTPAMHVTIKSADYIQYKTSSIPNFIKFWDEVRTYILTEKVRPHNIPSLIHKDIVRRLVSGDYANLGGGKFGNLSMDELYAVTQREFRPTDRIEFMKKLDDNTSFEFTSHYRPTAEFFVPFYDALLLYLAKFNEVYDILVFGIRDEQILPRCDTKPGGLIKAFAAKVPYQFANNILLLLPEQKWKSLSAFLHVFRAKLELCKEDSLCARRLRRLYGGTDYESRKHDTQRREQKLQQMQDVDPPEFEDRYDDSAEESAEDPDRVDTMLAAAMYPPRAKDQQQKPRSGKPGAPYDSSGPRDPLACLTKILHGVCNKKPCSYSHNEELVIKKRQEILLLVQKQQAAERTAGAPRTHPAQRVAAMADLRHPEDIDEGY